MTKLNKLEQEELRTAIEWLREKGIGIINVDVEEIETFILKGKKYTLKTENGVEIVAKGIFNRGTKEERKFECMYFNGNKRNKKIKALVDDHNLNTQCVAGKTLIISNHC